MFELGEEVTIDNEIGRIVGLRLVDQYSTSMYQTVEYQVYVPNHCDVRTFTNQVEMIPAFRES